MNQMKKKPRFNGLYLTGFFSQMDDYGRPYIMFHSLYDTNIDKKEDFAYNFLTNQKYKGNSPIKQDCFIVKPTKSTLYKKDNKLVTYDELLNHIVKCEVFLRTYDIKGNIGWYLSLKKMIFIEQ
jgi:hypothetical protein